MTRGGRGKKSQKMGDIIYGIICSDVRQTNSSTLAKIKKSYKKKFIYIRTSSKIVILDVFKILPFLTLLTCMCCVKAIFARKSKENEKIKRFRHGQTFIF